MNHAARGTEVREVLLSASAREGGEGEGAMRIDVQLGACLRRVTHTACFNICTGDIGTSFAHPVLSNHGR